MLLNRNCKYFRGDIPCKPHKKTGVHCDNCKDFSEITKRILIIKLGAAGDVIRTTPLLEKLNKIYPGCHITWLTDFPDLVPISVDEIVKLGSRQSDWAAGKAYDILYCLDKDKEAIIIGEQVSAKEKFGFGMDEFGRARAFNQLAEHKLFTGVFDDVSIANKKSYPQEIFEICGFEFNGEKYVLEYKSGKEWSFDKNKPLIGLNTGCGSRWPSRLWPNEYWISLATEIQKNGMNVLWLGGPDEDSKNKTLQSEAGGIYLGHFPFQDFISLIDQTDAVVTQVTMAMHLALGLGKKLILMNNIFNKYEFEMYGLGEIVEPSEPCDCYYAPVCPHDSMEKIEPERIFETLTKYIKN